MGMRSRGAAIVFVAPAFLCLAGTIGYPLAEAVRTSLYRWNLISGVRRWHGFQNYIDIAQDPQTARVAVITLLYTGLSVAIELILGFALAAVFQEGLARRLRGFALLRVAFCVPIVIAPLIWAFYFKSIYSPQFGAFNLLLGWFGLGPVPWVNTSSLALYSLIVADAWQWTPFMFAIILAGMLALPGEVIEAAKVDGADRLRLLWWIEIPLLKPVLLVSILLRLIDSIKNIDLIIVITQGGPGTSTEILNFHAYRTSFEDFQIGRGAALAILVLMLIMVLVAILLATLRRFSGGESAA
jgi:multiple sugar transport system permease protein